METSKLEPLSRAQLAELKVAAALAHLTDED